MTTKELGQYADTFLSVKGFLENSSVPRTSTDEEVRTELTRLIRAAALHAYSEAIQLADSLTTSTEGGMNSHEIRAGQEMRRLIVDRIRALKDSLAAEPVP